MSSSHSPIIKFDVDDFGDFFVQNFLSSFKVKHISNINSSLDDNIRPYSYDLLLRMREVWWFFCCCFFWGGGGGGGGHYLAMKNLHAVVREF